MNKQEYRKESHLFVPLKEKFSSTNVNTYWPGSLKTENETVHVILVNADNTGEVREAIKRDLDIVATEIKDSEGDAKKLENLQQQEASLAGMFNNIQAGSSMIHEAPQDLIEAVSNKLRHNLDKDDVIYSSGLSYYSEHKM